MNSANLDIKKQTYEDIKFRNEDFYVKWFIYKSFGRSRFVF